jgi:hypothetical protein
MIVNFKKCSPQVLKDMVEGFYDKTDIEHRIWDSPDIDRKWSPAEVNQILFRNFDTPLLALDELLDLKPSDLYGFRTEGYNLFPESEESTPLQTLLPAIA